MEACGKKGAHAHGQCFPVFLTQTVNNDMLINSFLEKVRPAVNIGFIENGRMTLGHTHLNAVLT